MEGNILDTIAKGAIGVLVAIIVYLISRWFSKNKKGAKLINDAFNFGVSLTLTCLKGHEGIPPETPIVLGPLAQNLGIENYSSILKKASSFEEGRQKLTKIKDSIHQKHSTKVSAAFEMGMYLGIGFLAPKSDNRITIIKKAIVSAEEVGLKRRLLAPLIKYAEKCDKQIEFQHKIEEYIQKIEKKIKRIWI